VLPKSILSDLSSRAANASLVRLENIDCISNYRQSMLNQFSNLLMISTAANSSAANASSVLRYYHHFPTPPWIGDSAPSGANWICGESEMDPNKCDFSYYQNHASSWNLTANIVQPLDDTFVDGEARPLSAPPISVDYCLAQPVTPICTVQLIPGKAADAL
jgi:hypothetical protein